MTRPRPVQALWYRLCRKAGLDLIAPELERMAATFPRRP